MLILLPAIFLLAPQTKPVQLRPQASKVLLPAPQPALDAQQRLQAFSAIERWRPKFGPTFASLALDPEQLALEARSKLAAMNFKAASNHKVIEQATMWMGPTVHRIVGFNAAYVNQATNDIRTATGIQAPSNVPVDLTPTPSALGVPSTAQPPSGGSPGAALREFDLALPLTERSVFDNGSAFEGDSTIHIFNGGQIISPSWSTKISLGQVLPLEAPPAAVAVNVELATDREYFAGAFTAYATISASMTIAVTNLEGAVLSSSNVDLGGAAAPFIGQATPHFVAPITVQLPTADAGGRGVKLVITARSHSTLIGPGAVAEDVRVSVRKVHVSWIPS
jgi:hypothetical protein